MCATPGRIRSIRAVPPPIRRSDTDACPGALRLHAAADGPLARVRLPGGMLRGVQLAVLGELAERWGDGHLELTSRANVQLRALTRADPADLAVRLAAAGLLPSRTHEVVRNIAAPPTAAAPMRELVRELDRELCADPGMAALPGRFLFAIGDVPLAADLAAVPVDDGFAVLFAGREAGLRIAAGAVVPTLTAAARAFLDLRGGQPAWRLAELADGPARVAERVAATLGVPLTAGTATTLGVPLTAGTATTRSVPVAPIGLLKQADGLVAVGAAVPLGRLSGAQTAILAAADRLVLTPWRGVLVPDLRPGAAADWSAALAGAGLPVEPDARWSGVTACAGRPGCAKALADVRADALAATRFVDGLPVHWLGCARGCGSPVGAHVRVEAGPGGYAVTGPAGMVTAVRDDLAEIVAAARRA